MCGSGPIRPEPLCIPYEEPPTWPAESRLGVGLRTVHFQHISGTTAVDWFEVISENFMDSQVAAPCTHQIAQRYPVVMHGVSLSIGSTDPLDFDYLRRLKRLADAIHPFWILTTSAGLAWRPEYA